MPTTPAALLERLNAIAAALERSRRALALIGLGSVGSELERLDRWSDLDFFVIARPGERDWFIQTADWLQGAAPLAYTFRNTPDGSKVLFQDGIYAEFAVFGPQQLPELPLWGARLVWAAPDFPQGQLPQAAAPGSPPATERAHHLGEALTNLLVGLGRFWRGERLSALKFVQEDALGHVLALDADRAERAAKGAPGADAFGLERRFEQRYPEVARLLPAFAPGYGETPQAALALLEHLERHEEVPPAMSCAIREAAQPPNLQSGPC
ncbi:hypothetical protein [Deinococcus koreensis]|uniref:Uncharacterized protein n=1 Tax=Deinococcus koreensis TaxID=2054903 RepID=A0A2K3UUY6_9DEIO|nr:hypothetical protein [Deinococcus koreensis]PNY80348.1 hypothetical protein CVO96_02290 [Deinococcus koreensis]